jgi:GNAT superfamily N-acetyltransferase
MRRLDPQSEEVRFLAWEPSHPDTIAGLLTFYFVPEGAPSYEEKKDEAVVEVEVLGPYRRAGIGLRLLQKALELADEYDRSLLVGHAAEEDGTAFLKAVGAHFARTSRESRLSLGTLDWEMVERWARAGPLRSLETSLHWFGNHLDDEYLEPYAALFTEVFNDAPRGELDTGDLIVTPKSLRDWEARADASGERNILAVSREADGVLSGMTEMGYWAEQKTMIHQFMTGVGRPYRGRGLGKWLKAAMLLKVREEYPQVDVVVTDNATTNAAMLAINNRLGFKLHKEWESVQISRERLRRWIESKRGS